MFQSHPTCSAQDRLDSSSVSQSHDHDHHHIDEKALRTNPALRRSLIGVIVLNLGMFLVDMVTGSMAGSRSLWADGLDFLGDGLTYGLSLVALSWRPRSRARAAMFKAMVSIVMAICVLIVTAYQVFVLALPSAPVMSVVAIMGLMANGASVLLVMGFRNGDANLRSVWQCSRNDMIGNIAVLVAAAGVFGTGTAWPDLIVAAIMAGLFLQTAYVIFRQARAEMLL